MSSQRPRLLSFLVVLIVFNALLTAAHYILILGKVIPINGDLSTIIEFTVADFIVVIVPSLLAAVGLWRLKFWAWVLTFIVCGGYIHGIISVLTEAVLSSKYGVMTIVSVYFIVVSLGITVYLWFKRRIFWDTGE